MHIVFPMGYSEITSGVFMFVYFILSQNVQVSKALRSECMVDTQGTSARVICIFDTDVSKLPNDFQIDRIPLDDPNNNQETVFMCQKSQGKPEYTHRRGYQLLGTVSANITLQIDNVTQEYAGKYMCAVIPSDPSEVKLCELRLKENVVKSCDTTVGIRDPLTPSINEGPASFVLPLVVGLSVAVFIIIVVTAYIFYRRREAHNGNLNDNQSPLMHENIPAPESA